MAVFVSSYKTSRFNLGLGFIIWNFHNVLKQTVPQFETFAVSFSACHIHQFVFLLLASNSAVIPLPVNSQLVLCFLFLILSSQSPVWDPSPHLWGQLKQFQGQRRGVHCIKQPAERHTWRGTVVRDYPIAATDEFILLSSSAQRNNRKHQSVRAGRANGQFLIYLLLWRFLTKPVVPDVHNAYL